MNTTDTATIPEAADRVAAVTPTETAIEATDDVIRVRAYHLWEAAGLPSGWADHFWVRAERELQDKALTDALQASSDTPIHN